MRKIAAHYWLRPDASIGKFPIITLNDDHTIVEIRERDTFQEEAALELINGLLVPGLVDFYSLSPNARQELDIRKYLNRFIIGGVKALAVPKDQMKIVRAANRSRDLYLHPVDQVFYDDGEEMGFGKIQQAGDSLKELLQLTRGNATCLGIDYRYGTLEVGKCPGILAISNLCYETLSINRDSRLRLIVESMAL
ncbi:hypothetical protein JCM21142_1675 [Saccharicrinis fermentans DSM 9555 = JCM 21142]|uniref:Uncharacterized protein n=2 Tax=Saccharicrinis fermentans TaxID=982 RepID=W7YHK4_9BACT|nr:hypothetical protein JCM21142_1675 [Saccharicrinis fermentans DSM 9555 = JCM 21142]